MGIKGIAAAFDVSRNTVRKYVRLWQDSSLTIEQLLALPEHRLREMFIPKGVRHREPSPRQTELEALLPEYAVRLSRKGVTVKSLYEDTVRRILKDICIRPSVCMYVSTVFSRAMSQDMSSTLRETRCISTMQGTSLR